MSTPAKVRSACGVTRVSGRPQAGGRGDHQRPAARDRRARLRRSRERQRIGQLALEIQSADKGKHFTERGAILTPQTLGKIERGAIGKHDLGAASATMGRREQETRPVRSA